MIDDVSTDNSIDVIIEKLKEYPRLNNRITLIRNG